MNIELTDKNFKEEVEDAKAFVLVDFWAPWCGPCQMMGPIIEELSEEFKGRVKVGKFNVDENPNIAGKYEILSIPALKIFKDGKVIKEIIGLQPKKVLLEKINDLINH